MTYYDLAEVSARIANDRLHEQGIDSHISADWIYAQWRYESGDFTSRMNEENNNPGGLTQVEPNGEENRMTNSNLYAKVFDTPEEYADYFGRYLAKYAENGIGNATTVDEYLQALQQGGYFTPADNSDDKYYQGVHAKLGDSYSPITALGRLPADRMGHVRYGHDYIPDAPEPYEERDPLSRFADSAADALLDSGVTSSLRYLWSWINPEVRGSISIPGFDKMYSPSDEEIDYVKKLLPGDATAQNFVLSSAHSQEHMYMLAAMKKQDYDRALRLARDGHSDNADIAGTVGSFVGGFLDPINLALMAVGVGEVSLAAKGLGVAGKVALGRVMPGVTEETAKRLLIARLGTNADKLSTFASSTAARMAANAAAGASLMGADRYITNKYGGFEANYAAYMTQAAVLGNAFDAIRLVKRAIPRSSVLQKVYGHLRSSETNLIQSTFDLKPVDTIAENVKRELKLESEKAVPYTVDKRTHFRDKWNADEEIAKTGKVTDANMEKLKETEQKDLVPAKELAWRLSLDDDEMARMGLMDMTDAHLWRNKKLYERTNRMEKEERDAFVAANNENRGAFVLSSDQATQYALRHGIKIDGKTVSFIVPGTKMGVIIGDRVLSRKQLLRHLNDLYTKRTPISRVISTKMQERWLANTEFNKGNFTTFAQMLEKYGDDLDNPFIKEVCKEARKCLHMLRKQKPTKTPSDKKVLEWVKWSTKAEEDANTPIRVSPDGTAYIFDTAFDANSPLNWNTEKVWIDEQEAVDKMTQSTLPKWIPKVVGRHLESNTLFKTIYGVLGNSTLKAMRELNDKLFLATRGRAGNTEGVVCAERSKQYLLNRVSPKMNNYYDARNAWLEEHKAFKFQGQMRKEFDRQVMMVYNLKYAMNKNGIDTIGDALHDHNVLKAATTLKDIRDECLKIMQEDAESHGGVAGNGSYADKNWTPLDEEFTRKVDNEMLTKLMNFMGNDREWMVKKLTEYAKMAVKRDIVRKQLEMEHDKAFKEATEKWKVDMDKYNEKVAMAQKEAAEDGVDPEEYLSKLPKPPERPVFEELTDKEVNEEINKKCLDWAIGTVDQRESEAVFSLGGVYGENIPSFMKNRLPMDTTTKMPLEGWDKSVIDFSFDTHLRDVNTDTIIHSYINRVCGEVAAHDVLGDWRTLGTLDKIQQALTKSVTEGRLSKTAAEEQRNALAEGMSRLLSTNMDAKPKTLMDAFSNLFRTKSYADVGGQMFMAQLGEFGSAMAYAGTRVLFDSIPILRGIRRKMLSKADLNLETMAADIRLHTWGNELSTRFWDRNSDYESRSFRDALGWSSKIAKRLDDATGITKIMSNVTSTLNQLPKLTDWMVNEARISGIIDSIKWANGYEVGKLRNPFSEYFLKAAHVTDVDALKKDIQKYIGNGKAKPTDLDKWRKTNPSTYFQWRNLMENYSGRAIQQMSIGNTPLLKEANWFTKLLFQFKDYSLRAVNDQTLKALSSRQMDDFLAAIASMGTNTMAYMGLVYLRAWAKYPNDPEGRKQYIEKNITWGRLGWAAISRGAITGSIPSFGSDIYEIITGTPMMRTTVNNSYKSKSGQTNSFGDIAGRVVDQMPALSSTLNPVMAATGAAYKGATDGLSKEDVASVMKVLPFNGFWGMTLAASEIQDLTGTKTRKEMNDDKRRMEKRESGRRTNNRPKDDAASNNNGSNGSSALSNLMNVK